MTHEDARKAVVAAARALNESGLNRGTSGNVSARVSDGMVITPSALPYEETTPENLVLMSLDGEILDAGPLAGKPSTEWRLHAGILASRPDVHSVLHTHPEFSTTLACLELEIPAVHYMVAVAGGTTIPCAEYATFGTPALAEVVVAALENRTACLLAHHGLVTVGPSPEKALALAVEVEALAAVYWRALQVREPKALSAEEMARVLAEFREYRP